MNWDWVTTSDETVALRHLPATSSRHAEWPAWLPEDVVEGIRSTGVSRPFAHQVAFAELARAGRHAAICTPTGSGKSLAYLMPILAAADDTTSARGFVRRRPTALYLAPTKALAHDQARAATALAPAGCAAVRPAGERRHRRRRPC